MARGRRFFRLSLLLIANLGFFVLTASTQITFENFQKVLQENAEFTAGDVAALDRGESIVKLLPVSDKREISVLGVVRLPSNSATALQAFRFTMGQRNRRSIVHLGHLSNSPSTKDLALLTLEDRDLEDLKVCVPGQCKMKLSAAMIERFHQEIDWSAPDYKDRANNLFRQMLADYVRDYLSQGDSALIWYHDQSVPVSLAAEHRSLIEASIPVNSFLPELKNYASHFPRPPLPNKEVGISWSKLKFGLRPVIIITEVLTYETEQRIVYVSRQIYANHYFDSSLGVASFITLPQKDGSAVAYLLYGNNSRADALAGTLSTVKRNLTQSEAIKNLKDLLEQTSINADRIATNQTASLASEEKGLSEGSVSLLLILLLGGLAVLICLLWFVRSRFSPPGHPASL